MNTENKFLTSDFKLPQWWVLGCYAALMGGYISTFWDNLLVLSPRAK